MKITQQLLRVCLVSLLFLSCAEKEPEAPVEIEFCLSAKFKEKVDLKEAIVQQVTEGIHLTGAVETNPDKVIQFVSLMGGIISKTYFSLGDEVKKGQMLAELRSTELSSLDAELKNLNSQIQVAQNTLQASQSMFEDGISSQKELLQAQTDLYILKSEKQKVTSNLNLFSASAEKGVFQIKAPAAGIITSKSVASGSTITAEGEPLFTISDLNEVWVMVDVYATNVQYIQPEMQVELKTLSYPDTTFQGKIGVISQILDSNAKVLKARIVMENKDLKLKPGMLVDVIALKDSSIEAVSIPTKAMVFDNNQNYVVVYKSDCDLQIRKVEILSKNNGTTFIANGLEKNDVVVTKNQLLVYEQIKN